MRKIAWVVLLIGVVSLVSYGYSTAADDTSKAKPPAQQEKSKAEPKVENPENPDEQLEGERDATYGNEPTAEKEEEKANVEKTGLKVAAGVVVGPDGNPINPAPASEEPKESQKEPQKVKQTQSNKPNTTP